MSDEQVFFIGGGHVRQITGSHGKTPPCPEAKFKRGDIVKVRRNRTVGHFPSELIVLVADKSDETEIRFRLKIVKHLHGPEIGPPGTEFEVSAAHGHYAYNGMWRLYRPGEYVALP